MSELSQYMYSLGHGVPAAELEKMLHEVGIDEDQDGAINQTDFLEFIRRCLVANLPSSRVPTPLESLRWRQGEGMDARIGGGVRIIISKEWK